MKTNIIRVFFEEISHLLLKQLNSVWLDDNLNFSFAIICLEYLYTRFVHQ